MCSSILMSVPNVSDGRNRLNITRIGDAFTPAGPADGVRLLDVHSDADHDRTVFTLAGEATALTRGLLAGARATVATVDVVSQTATPGVHPRVGALDVLPLVYLRAEDRGAACAQALVIGDQLAEELALPVFLYGELAAGRTRAQLRAGGVQGLRARIESGECRPDFGPARMHQTAGATLLAARQPLVAFNLELAAPASVDDAKTIAALIREGGTKGLPGLRAIGLQLSGGVVQLSMNLERPTDTPLVEIVRVVREYAEVARAELVGLAPRAALERFPDDLPMPGFDPARHVIENALGKAPG
jgi:glutamate formiminotransferase / 5-formyltetrahydrofolate cyclo-ligase